ncbi:MAG TPA: CaiB/BaiF CoA-transferase family protein [Burkholderiaceae bacterium]|nr:CaiB/BaiF CoA-transferase family protein [Burkholderiaceae bacterium]
MTLLEGTRVLDLSRLLPGPLAAWHLQSAGAHVDKIESPGEGDYARSIGTRRKGAASSTFYELLNAGKQVRVLDLKTAHDRDALLAEINRYDVLIESFRPGVMNRLGLGADVLRKRAPRLVQVSVVGYGSDSPLAHAAGHDLNYLAHCGLLHEYLPAATDAEARLLLPNFQWADVLGGAMSAAFAAVCGIWSAARTGQGCHIEVAMAEAMRLAAPMATAEAVAGACHASPGCGLLNGGVPCYDVYRCADGRWLALGALEHKFWAAFCEAIGRPDWIEQHWQRGQAPGSVAARALRAQVADVLAARTCAEWIAILAGSDCCASEVRSLADVLAGQPLPGAVFRVRD